MRVPGVTRPSLPGAGVGGELTCRFRLWAGRVLTGRAGWQLEGVQRCLAALGVAGARQVGWGARVPGWGQMPLGPPVLWVQTSPSALSVEHPGRLAPHGRAPRLQAGFYPSSAPSPEARPAAWCLKATTGVSPRHLMLTWPQCLPSELPLFSGLHLGPARPES